MLSASGFAAACVNQDGRVGPLYGRGGAVTDHDFDDYVARRWRWAARVAYLLTGDWGLAEDLAQETFAVTYRHWDRMASMDHPDAYVRRILITRYLRSVRKRRVLELLTDGIPDRTGTSDVATEVANSVVLSRAVRQLPPRMRATLVLRYYDDLSEADIAELLGCSAGTVKTQLSRGLERLRHIVPELAKEI
jgi:RNA polymerase sigma-70 factor (sigma-E family)